MAFKVVLASEGVPAVTLRTHEGLVPVWVVRFHMRLQVMLPRGH